MRYAAIKGLCCLSISVILLDACHKDQSTPTGPTPPPITGTMTLSTPIDSAFELIASEPGGKILYDSLFTGNTSLTTILHTNDSLIDLTFLLHDPKAGFYDAIVYKGVNPSSWKSIYPGSFNVPYTPTATTHNATITYINLPSLADFGAGANTIFYDFMTQGGGLQTEYSSSPPFCQFRFVQYGNNPDYLLLQTAGLYNLHTPLTTNDTVDLSNMDTAATLNFERPSGYPTLNSVSLVGYRDTNDFSNSTMFYFYYNQQTNKPAFDLLYPPVSVQKYELTVSVTNSNNEFASYYSYLDTIPRSFPVYDASEYTTIANQADNFSLRFESVKPGYYIADFAGGTQSTPVYCTIYSSPDSASLRPASFLASLYSKTLKDVNLGSLVASELRFGMAGGLNYGDYQAYIHNPNQLATKRVTSSMQYQKNF